MNLRRVSLVLLMTIAVFAGAQQATPKASSSAESSSFSVNDANAVLAQFRSALESHSERKLFALFDEDKMTGALSFEDQLRGFFSRNETIRVNIRSIQASGDESKGSITATFEIETASRSGDVSRRQEQLQLDLIHSDRGWRIADLNPRSFFS